MLFYYLFILFWGRIIIVLNYRSEPRWLIQYSN